MIDEARLVALFKEELRQGGRLEDAIHAVRIAVETVCTKEILAEEEHRWAFPCSRGPAPDQILSVAQVDTIKAVVAAEFRMTVGQMMAGTIRDCVRARFVTAAVIRRFDLSYPQIAKFLHFRDHTRALHSIRVVERTPELLVIVDGVFRKLVTLAGWSIPDKRTLVSFEGEPERPRDVASIADVRPHVRAA